MDKIKKFNGKMTSRQRVINTFRFEEADRVPINYDTNPGIHSRLAKALGASSYDDVLDALGVDFRGAGIGYNGPRLHKKVDGLYVDPVYGFYTRWIENDHGGYNDFCNFPLQNAAPEIIANYPVPNPDDFDYDGLTDKLEKYKDYAVYAGSPGFGDIINLTGMLMGMEDTLVNLSTQDEATLSYLDRRIDMQIGILHRLIEKSSRRIDFIWLGEDLGTQIAPMISLDMYRKVLRPRHQRFIDLAKSYNLPVMIHTCGCSSWVYEDFIEMGITAVDTLQPEAVNMSPSYLKEHFGKRLVFHGGISTAQLATGSVDDTICAVKNTLAIFMPTKGYMMAPCHQIQDNTPVENVIAMYNAAHNFGRYSVN